MDMYEELNKNCSNNEFEDSVRWSDNKYIDYINIENNYCYDYFYYECYRRELCKNCKEIIQKYKNEDTLRRIDLLKLVDDMKDVISDNKKLTLDIEKLMNDIAEMKEHLHL